MGGRQNRVDYGCFGAREYVINKPIYVPVTTTKLSKRFVHKGNGCTIRAVGDTSIFESVPTTQVNADIWISRQLYFENFYLVGNGGSKGNGQTGIRIGASKHLTLKNCEISDCDKNVDALFCLFGSFEDCQFTNAMSYNVWLHPGIDQTGVPIWAGAAPSNSASNDCDFWNCEIFNRLQSDYGVYLLAVSDINMYGCTTEGAESGTQANQPVAGIFYDDLNSTTVKGFTIDGLHAEQSYTDSVIKVKAREGIFQFNDVYNQKQGIYPTANRNIFNVESIAGEVFINMNNLKYPTQYQQFGITNGAYVRPYFTFCNLNGNPTTRAELQAISSMWSGAVPTYTGITPLMRT